MKLLILCFCICSSFLLISATPPGFLKNNKNEPKILCGPDTLLIFQDCKICHCPKANRHALCYRKSCEQRTKNTGSCPTAILSMDNYELCQPGPPTDPTFHPCKTDNECPGRQICCFDFCKRTYCTDPVPPPAPALPHGRQ